MGAPPLAEKMKRRGRRGAEVEKMKRRDRREAEIAEEQRSKTVYD
jgi:hypothetical protein